MSTMGPRRVRNKSGHRVRAHGGSKVVGTVATLVQVDTEQQFGPQQHEQIDGNHGQHQGGGMRSRAGLGRQRRAILTRVAAM